MGRLLSLSQLRESAEELSEFGLTPYQALVYLATVKLGPTTASNIAKAAGIRREEVYRTLPKLEKAGLIERVLGRPMRVRALSIEDALSLLIRRKENEADKTISYLKSKMQHFISSFEIALESTDFEDENSHFILISEKDAVSIRMASLIDNAKTRIDVMNSSENIIRFIMNYAESLDKLRKRKVTVRLLTNYPEDIKILPLSIEKYVPTNNFNLKYIEDIPSRYVVFDGTEVLLSTSIRGALTDSKCLWTNDHNLVSLIERDFDELYYSATDWESYKLTPSDRIAHMLTSLKPRDHIILVYNSLESKYTILFNYILNGIENNEAAVYVCSEETPRDVKDAMKNFGIDTEEHMHTGALKILDYNDIYIQNGKFNINEVMDKWSGFYEDALNSNFSGLRVTGEMQCFLTHQLVHELVEYEKALHTILDIPITAICAYNATDLQKVENSINVYSELVKAHKKVLYAGKDNLLGEIEIRVG
jgi:sugar-specific transcriptional regulator TrmB/archaellum biogenesis ATPase FlaH